MSKLLKTHCHMGHQMSGDNVSVYKTAKGVRRWCNQCKRERALSSYRRRNNIPQDAPALRPYRNNDAWFWGRVEVSGTTECWPWRGSRNDKGYGTVSWRGRILRAHRLALMLRSGTDPASEVCALHKCDNPPCCNPDHLYWGSKADNMRDAMERGRWKKPTGRWPSQK